VVGIGPVALGAVAVIDALDVAVGARCVQVVDGVLIAQQKHSGRAAHVEVHALAGAVLALTLCRLAEASDAGVVARAKVLPLDCFNCCHLGYSRFLLAYSILCTIRATLTR
jgi:hypothetical protein